MFVKKLAILAFLSVFVVACNDSLVDPVVGTGGNLEPAEECHVDNFPC